jgi:hypothetical protein
MWCLDLNMRKMCYFVRCLHGGVEIFNNWLVVSFKKELKALLYKYKPNPVDFGRHGQIEPTRVKTATEVATTRVGLCTERSWGSLERGYQRLM